jgi:hypothetical protein
MIFEEMRFKLTVDVTIEVITKSTATVLEDFGTVASSRRNWEPILGMKTGSCLNSRLIRPEVPLICKKWQEGFRLPYILLRSLAI